jgi:tRNA uridine 5-carboxymethylaminomethyl modification enzyme
MFTTRAEYRLTLRADNADRRLTALGEQGGVVKMKRSQRFSEKLERIESAQRRLGRLTLTPSEARRNGIAVRLDGARRDGHELLSLPGISFSDLKRVWPELSAVGTDVIEQIENDAQYSVYLDRQEADIQAFRRDEVLALPAGLDYGRIAGLSTEAAQKLASVQPATLGQAGRIDGVTPATLTLLLAHVRTKIRSGGRYHDGARSA